MRAPRLSNWFKTHGGPVYIEVGTNKQLQLSESEKYTSLVYPPSYVEFYYYKQPVIKTIYPHGGKAAGGTQVVIEGAWF